MDRAAARGGAGRLEAELEAGAQTAAGCLGVGGVGVGGGGVSGALSAKPCDEPKKLESIEAKVDQLTDLVKKKATK